MTLGTDSMKVAYAATPYLTGGVVVFILMRMNVRQPLIPAAVGGFVGGATLAALWEVAPAPGNGNKNCGAKTQIVMGNGVIGATTAVVGSLLL